MRIQVVFLGRAAEIVKKHVVKLELKEGLTLEDLIKVIGEKISRRFYRRYVEGHYVFIPLVNNVPINNPKYVLRDGDRVVFITPEMGG